MSSDVQGGFRIGNIEMTTTTNMTSDDGPRLSNSLSLITLSGSLAMVYTAAVASPLVTAFFREAGATDFDFGLLGGLPMALLSLQFIGAWFTNRIRRRKAWFMWLIITARLIYIPLAFLPLVAARIGLSAPVSLLVALVAISSGLGNFIGPLWLSWMGDLIPRRILNRYWGTRQRYMTLTWTMSFLAVAALTYHLNSIPANVLFPCVATIGVIAGVSDILLFFWIPEPEHVRQVDRPALGIILEPLRHPEFKSLLLYACCFTTSTMMAAAFMQIYTLEILKMPVWQANLVWCMAGIGNAMVAKSWGRIADRYGHRPVFVFCTGFKPCVALVFLLVTPKYALPVLAITFFFDNMFNGGNAIATNGYMLKMAPRKNRSAFIASVTALTGICGGISAIIAGTFLKSTAGLDVAFLGRHWCNYQILFALSFCLRVACVPLAAAVKEPVSASPRPIFMLLRNIWPMRMLLFPIGLYRRESNQVD